MVVRLHLSNCLFGHPSICLGSADLPNCPFGLPLRCLMTLCLPIQLHCSPKVNRPTLPMYDDAQHLFRHRRGRSCYKGRSVSWLPRTFSLSSKNSSPSILIRETKISQSSPRAVFTNTRLVPYYVIIRTYLIGMSSECLDCLPLYCDTKAYLLLTQSVICTSEG
jgi:hypothetical protein